MDLIQRRRACPENAAGCRSLSPPSIDPMSLLGQPVDLTIRPTCVTTLYDNRPAPRRSASSPAGHAKQCQQPGAQQPRGGRERHRRRRVALDHVDLVDHDVLRRKAKRIEDELDRVRSAGDQVGGTGKGEPRRRGSSGDGVISQRDAGDEPLKVASLAFDGNDRMTRL